MTGRIMNKTELRSADEWLADDEFSDITIMDPDGWDRSNFEVSWNEKITKEEFSQRLLVSTLIMKNPFWKRNQGAG
jgi:hypothetical protein